MPTIATQQTERAYRIPRLLEGDLIRQSHGECAHCSRSRDLYYFPVVDSFPATEPLCSSCFNTFFFSCNTCGQYGSRDLLGRIEGISNEFYHYCQDCAPFFFACSQCNQPERTRYIHSIPSEENERQSISVCRRCYRLYNEERGNEIAGRINDHSYKPRAKFHKAKDEKNVPYYFGFELEVEGDSHLSEKFNESYYYLKSDGSLNCGFELVSHPLSENWMKENFMLVKGTLNRFRQFKFRSFQTDTCGLHIHVSRKIFTTLDLYKCMFFFYNNQRFILTLSQRKAERLGQWAKIDRSPHAIAQKTKSGNNPDRYEAINLQNQNTVEFRIFKGTLDYVSFFKNFEFLTALIAFVKSHAIADMKTTAPFLQYVKENKKSFLNLITFLTRKAVIS